MKKVLLICALLLMAIMLSAEETGSFYIKEKMIVRQDLKIYPELPDSILSQKSGLLILSDINDLEFSCPTEIISVFKAPGSYRLTIDSKEKRLIVSRKDYKTVKIEFSELGIHELKSGKVYQIQLDCDQMSPSDIRDFYKSAPQEIKNNMVLINGGQFLMGSETGEEDERPAFKVTVKPFYMSRFEVTQKQWRSIMRRNRSKFRGDNLPVDNISWSDAVRFCNELSIKEGLKPCYILAGYYTRLDMTSNGYRLPTEEEWEYAAGGGEFQGNYIYSGSDRIEEVGWFFDNSQKKSHLVGIKSPNALGLFDMSGNVWEWCTDRSDSYDHKGLTTPEHSLHWYYRILRGGSWNNEKDMCRVKNRFDQRTTYKSNQVGLRLVRNIAI